MRLSPVSSFIKTSIGKHQNYIGLVGIPQYVPGWEMFFITNEPAPIIQLSPIDIPFNIVTLVPKYILLPIVTEPEELKNSI